MKTQFKVFQRIYGFGFLLLMLMSITSCNNNAEQELNALKALVPAESTDQVAYITKAINLYNTYQLARVSSERVGHPIAQSSADIITQVEGICLDTTEAVFFSMVNIFETLEQIGLDSIDQNTGLAVVFGKYPNKDNTAFFDEMVSKGINPVDYYNKPTVVLKYVKNLNPGLVDTKYFTRSNNETGRVTGANEQYVTNMGMGCPRNCPPGTN